MHKKNCQICLINRLLTEIEEEGYLKLLAKSRAEIGEEWFNYFKTLHLEAKRKEA